MSLKKKAASFLLAGCMALSSLPAALAVDTVQSLETKAQIVDSGTCGDRNENQGKNVTWTVDSEGTLTISGTGKMVSRLIFPSTLSAPWLRETDNNTYYDHIKKVIIEPGVTNIGGGIFGRHSNLESITIPNTVTSIDTDAFIHCTSLKSITIPASVKIIGSAVFNDCKNLESVYFIGDAPSVEESLFYYNNKVPPFQNIDNGTIYYPAGNATWTENAKNNLGIGIKWQEWTPPVSSIFTDVPFDQYYVDAVGWAIDKGVTNGTSATTFSPDNSCTRSQIMQMLWRAMGSPEPANTTNPFTDVNSNDYFYKAVLWAVEKGITSGTSPTTFGSGDTCTRAQAMTFLWNAKGQQSTSNSIAFTDVQSGDYFYNPVKWAVSKGVTSGTSAATFSPTQNCTRAQIVTFIYKAMN